MSQTVRVKCKNFYQRKCHLTNQVNKKVHEKIAKNIFCFINKSMKYIFYFVIRNQK